MILSSQNEPQPGAKAHFGRIRSCNIRLASIAPSIIVITSSGRRIPLQRADWTAALAGARHLPPGMSRERGRHLARGAVERSLIITSLILSAPAGSRSVVQFGELTVLITDKLRNYIKPINTLTLDADHRTHKDLNHAIEVSHQPTRKGEKIFGKFKSHRQAQRFLFAHDYINFIFRPPLLAHSNFIPPRPLGCLQPMDRRHL